MKTLEKMVASVAVAGLLFGGATPALASGDKDSERYHKYGDNKIKVLVVKHHKKSDHKWVVDHDILSVKEAAEYAGEKCDVKKWWKFLDEAKDTEKYNKKWVDVCSYHHGKNKNVKYHVVFKDYGK
ncbi:hypothetical protein [Kocuria sp. NPDC057446]|uniref:hypothetical protein n=1 Tax=Kocuria sp. NPDC057446 TaxID=3346137 RepID=UPI0036B92D76